MSAGALDRALARGMLVTAAFAALAGAARVAQDAAIAWHHGTGPSADAYYLVLSLVNWPTAMALSTLTLLVGPTEAALQQGNARQGARWRGELLGRVLLIAALSLPAAWWALHATVSGGWSGLDTAAMAAASTGIPLIVAAVPLGLLGALFAAWLVAAGRPVLTLMEAVPPLVLTLLLLTAQGPVLFWGTALGAALQVLAMAWLLHAAGALPRPRLHASADTAVLRASFARGAWVLLAGQGLFALVPLVDPFFAARTGEGMVAAMGFANRLVLGLQGLAGLALQRAGLPILSRLATESPGDAWRASQRWALVAAGAGAAVGLVVAAAAEPLVALLYEHGRFSVQDREQVAQLLRYGMLQMPPFLAGTVLVTALAASRGGHWLALAAGMGLVAKLTLSALLVTWHGVAGLLLATALMYTLTTALVWAALKRQLMVRRA